MEVLTLQEAARYVRVSEKTLREMAKAGRVPSQRVGREWRFLRQALEEWLMGYAGSSPGISLSKTIDQQHLLDFINIREPKKSGFSDTAFTNNREEPIHSWVPWIAGFSSSFVSEVLDREIEGKTKLTVLDPFAGVGTTLVEGIKRGYDVVGFEINPYAALACEVKLDAFKRNPEAIVDVANRAYAFVKERIGNGSSPFTSPPQGFHTKDRFLSPKVERQVLFMKDFISTEKEKWLKHLLLLVLGSVLVGVSNYSYEPSLGRRVAVGKAEILDADLSVIIRDKLLHMANDIETFLRGAPKIKKDLTTRIFKESYLESGIDRLGIASVDILITSPPYLNNYHYVRNTRPQLFWLDLAEDTVELRTLEMSSFGKFWQTVRGESEITLDFSYPDLEKKLKELRSLNGNKGPYGGPGWANYAATYFNDCARFVSITAQVMKPEGLVIIVIGNNILQGIEFKTEEFLAQIARKAGFEVRGLHMVRKKRTGSSIINSGVRVGHTKKRTELYEVAIELRAPK